MLGTTQNIWLDTHAHTHADKKHNLIVDNVRMFSGDCCPLVAVYRAIVLWRRINNVPLLWTGSRKLWFWPEHESVRNKEDSCWRHVGRGSVSGQCDAHEDGDRTGSWIQVELSFLYITFTFHEEKIPQTSLLLLFRYYIAVLTLISFSLILQIVAGVLIIIIGEQIPWQFLRIQAIVVPNRPELTN